MNAQTSTTTTTAHAIRVLNELDHVRIGKLLDPSSSAHEAVQALLDNADLVPPAEMAPDVVTMRSRVRVSDLDGGGSRELSVVYPAEADATRGEVSVLSPVGTALLGLKVGEVGRWLLPDGREAALRVDALLFQPEASGEHLR